MYKLHYQGIERVSGQVHDFNTQKEMIDFINKIEEKNDVIWALSKMSCVDYFVSCWKSSIEEFLANMPEWQTEGPVFLYEFPSYEEAYTRILSALENSDGGYDNVRSRETKDSLYWKYETKEFMDSL